MKVLIIQQKMIGDVLTSSILFEVLRQKYPLAQLDYLINEHTYPVVENNPFISNFIYFTKKDETSKIALYKLAKSIKHTNYDVVIDVYSKFSSNFISAISGAKTKISKYKWYTSFLYTHTFKEGQKTKNNTGLAIENRLALLTPILDEIPAIVQPKVFLSENEIAYSKQFLLNSGIDLKSPLFMLSILGSGENKTYPLEYMAKIVDAIVKETNAQILFNYIPKQESEAKQVYNLCLNETKKNIFINVYGDKLRTFLTITKHCNALIGNEGGAINMAKALDIPTFTIFSPWISKEAWSLFEDGKKHVSIHLKDVKPEFYKNTTSKKAKETASSLYDSFKPSFIIPKLNDFLKNI